MSLQSLIVNWNFALLPIYAPHGPAGGGKADLCTGVGGGVLVLGVAEWAMTN